MGSVLAFLTQPGGWTDAMLEVAGSWFFAVFCTLYAIVQGRVYFMFRRRMASEDSETVATDVPVSAHGYFTIVWAALALAAIAYGIAGIGGWRETAAWVTILLVICIQLLVLGKLDRRIQL